MAVKFIKSLFTLNDKALVVEIKEGDLFGCVSSIIDETKGNQRNINMLQSAALELLNIFSAQIKSHFDMDEFKLISAIYAD